MIIPRIKYFAESYEEQTKRNKTANLVGAGGVIGSIGAAVGYNKLANKLGTKKIEQQAQKHLDKGADLINAESKKLVGDAILRRKIAGTALKDKARRDISSKGPFSIGKIKKNFAKDLRAENLKLAETKNSIANFMNAKKADLNWRVSNAVDRSKGILKRKNSDRALAIGAAGIGLSLAARELLKSRKKKEDPVLIDASNLYNIPGKDDTTKK
jgi:hypothetical protein